MPEDRFRFDFLSQSGVNLISVKERQNDNEFLAQSTSISEVIDGKDSDLTQRSEDELVFDISGDKQSYLNDCTSVKRLIASELLFSSLKVESETTKILSQDVDVIVISIEAKTNQDYLRLKSYSVLKYSFDDVDWNSVESVDVKLKVLNPNMVLSTEINISYSAQHKHYQTKFQESRNVTHSDFNMETENN